VNEYAGFGEAYGFGDADEDFTDGFGDDAAGGGDGAYPAIAEDEGAYLTPIPLARQQVLDSIYLSMSEAADTEAEKTEAAPLKVAEDEYVCIDGVSVAPVAVYLSPTVIGAGPTMNLITADKSTGKGESKVACMYSGSVQVFPPFSPEV